MMNCSRYACDCNLRTGIDVFIRYVRKVGTIEAFRETELDHVIVRTPDGKLYGGPKEAFMRV